MALQLSPQEVGARQPVWEALADFWLDTELSEFEFDHIASLIASSPYSIEEVRRIHDYEVTPALYANVLSVAGVWSGFDSEWLNARCQKFAARRQSRLFRAVVFLRRPLFRSFTEAYWRKVIPRVCALRAGQAQANVCSADH